MSHDRFSDTSRRGCGVVAPYVATRLRALLICSSNILKYMRNLLREERIAHAITKICVDFKLAINAFGSKIRLLIFQWRPQ